MKLKMNGIIHVIVEIIDGERFFHSTANSFEEALERKKHFEEVEKKFNRKSKYDIEIYTNEYKKLLIEKNIDKLLNP